MGRGGRLALHEAKPVLSVRLAEEGEECEDTLVVHSRNEGIFSFSLTLILFLILVFFLFEFRRVFVCGRGVCPLSGKGI